MISKRVMLAGALVVGISYALAIERVSVSKSDAHLTTSGEPHTSVSSAQALPYAQDQRVERELAELANGVAILKNDVTELRADKPAEQLLVEPSAPTPKTEQQLQAEHDEYMAGIERAFEQEARDERWAKGTGEQLRETLKAQPVMLAALRGIECRSSSCRVEIHDDGSGAFAEEFPLIVHELGAVLPEIRFSHSELGGGAQLQTLYMSKTSPSAADEL